MKYVTDKIEWTPAMKAYVETDASVYLARVIKDLDNIVVKLTKLNNSKIKISVSLKSIVHSNLKTFRAQAVDCDFYAAADNVFSNLKSIILKHNDKYNKIKNETIINTDVPVEDGLASSLILKEKIFMLDPITVDEALEEIGQTDYNFYVFKDIDDGNVISIIYKRLDDTYGIIRCK